MSDLSFDEARGVLLRETRRMMVRELTTLALEMQAEVGPYREAVFLFASLADRTRQRVTAVLQAVDAAFGKPQDNLAAAASATALSDILTGLEERVIRPLRQAKASEEEDSRNVLMDVNQRLKDLIGVAQEDLG